MQQENLQWLLKAYGYYPETQTVTIEQDGEVTANFTLEELPKGNVSGTITNQEPVNQLQERPSI